MGTTGQSITLANSIIGVGILAMPFCFQQCGVLLATLILLLLGFVSRLCCYFLLKSAILTRRRTFEFLAFHVFGPAGKLAVEVGIIGYLMGTCIAYFVVVGDLGPQIIAKMFNINQSDILRTSIMVIVSLVCVLPLGLLRNVDSLSNVSAATICFYFCLVIKVILEATSQLLTADWHIRIETWKPSGVLQCVPIFSMALFCQTQLFEIFDSLPSLSLERMNVVTKNAINICTAVYFTLGFFGYVAFSSQTISGNILTSLSPTFASDVIKLGFVMSLAFSFPLIIFPCRASLYSFLYKKAHPAHHDHTTSHCIPAATFRRMTVAIVAAALSLGLLLPNVELVLGLVGATIGVLVCVLFPAACYLRVTRGDTDERLLAKVVIVLGLIILVLGTYANLQAAEKSTLDDKYITQERIDKMVEDFFQKQEKGEGIIKIAEDNNAVVANIVENKVPNEILKDSEVQPPNPIPPESHSNEKAPDSAVQVKSKLKQNLPDSNIIKDTANVISETRPRDLKIKLEEAKLINGNSKVESSNIGKRNENPNSKPDSYQEKSDIIKQQKLIETIKQHGEEQKELIKEQKEILHEILKTKKELEKDKKEVDETEAKKIAVESIQKIANMAIQSLSGVTDKPVGEIGTGDKKAEPIQKIADKAVQEIAKKAAETLEAIGEIKESKEKLKSVEETKLNKDNIQIQNNKNIEPVQNNIKPQIRDQNVLPQSMIQTEKNNPPIIPQNLNNFKQEDLVANPSNQDITKSKEMNKNDIIENRLQNAVNELKKQVKANEQLNAKKEHSHSPDEPQSYKQGEDLLKKNVETNLMSDSIAQNIPIPLALKGNSQSNNEIQPQRKNVQIKAETDIKQTKVDLKDNIIGLPQSVVNTNGANNENLVQNNENNPNSRQKREIKYEENTKFKQEDNPNCDSNVMHSHKVNVPKHSNVIHRRSLKSYKEDAGQR